MITIDLINARKVFDNEVSYQIQQAVHKSSKTEKENIIKEMDRKVKHTDATIHYGLKAIEELELNESIKDFIHLALLDHDIGCFAQMRYTGSYKDYILEKAMKINNHGQLGDYRLEEIINEQLPNAQVFHSSVRTIVKEHVDKNIDQEDLYILTNSILKNYSMEEIIKNKNKVRKDVLNSIIQLIQDQDKLESIYQILSENYDPFISKSNIDPKVYEMFYNGEYLNIKNLKKRNLWNSSVIELVRLSIFNQIKLLSVAKVIQKENLIMKLKEHRNNSKLDDAYYYMNERFNKMIENTEDNITLGKVK